MALPHWTKSRFRKLWRPLIVLGAALWALASNRPVQADEGEAACLRALETRKRVGVQEEVLADAGRCAEVVKRRAGAAHPDYGLALYNLADVLAIPALKRGSEAVALNREARDIFEKAADAEPGNAEWPRRLVKTCERLVLAGDEAAANMEKALTTVRGMETRKLLDPWEKGWPDDLERDLLRAVALHLIKSDQFAQALPIAERFAGNVERSETAEGTSRDGAAKALSGAAWTALLARQPQKALETAERVMALVPGKIWPAVNRAHALMFLGRTDEARALYLKHKGESVYDTAGAGGALTQKRSPQDKWEIAAAWDFAQLRQHGLENPLMAEIESALRVTESPLVVLRQARELMAEDRNAEALALYQGYIEKVKARFGETSVQHASLLQNFAHRLPEMGRPDMAEEVSKHALTVTEELAKKRASSSASSGAGLADDMKLVDSLLMLSGVYEKQGRARDAEPLAVRALDLCEKSPRTDQDALACLTRGAETLAHVYAKSGSPVGAQRALKRAVAAGEKKWGAGHPNIVKLLHELAAVSDSPERSKIEARINGVLDKAITADQPDADFEAAAKDPRLAELAQGYVKQGQFAAAERALKLFVKGSGAASACDSLLELYRSQNNFSEIDAYYKAVLLEEDRYRSPLGCMGRRLDFLQSAEKYFRERQNGAEASKYQRLLIAAREQRLYSWNHEWTASFASDFDHLAKLYAGEGRQKDAEAAARRASELSPRREENDRTASPEQPAADRDSQVAFVKDAHRLFKGAGGAPAELADRAFVAAQRAQLLAASGMDAPAPLTIAQTRNLLRPDEAVVLFLEAPEEKLDVGYVWAVTTKQVEWERIEFGARLSKQSLRSRVQFLRCGLDPTNWAPGSPARQDCERLREAETQEKLLLLALKDPGGDRASLRRSDNELELGWFEPGAAYDLYQTLFGPIQEAVNGKRLLIAPDGPLAQLPFHALVTEKPRNDGESLADAHWMARSQAVSILPSVGGLGAAGGKNPAKAPKVYAGFGNPLLDGQPGNKSHAKRAEQAQARQSCNEQGRADEHAEAGMLPLSSRGSLFRGGQADPTRLRQQLPLPETAAELCAVARGLGAETGDVWLGKRMTEAILKGLDKSGQLQNYRILHFATHSLVAGQPGEPGEPALAFSPPEKGADLDDGLLTASEAAQLKLNAEWVVLSACNTAANSSEGSGALTGLARAFFRAGARALLVSSWPVNSDAAAAITTGTFSALKDNPGAGRAEALRRSMLALIDKGGNNAHPYIWAPFALVGEEGR